MENPEGVLNLLDEFAKVKSKEIPNDLEEYLLYVAASGDPVYQWSLIKSLYRQKLINVITDFYESSPVMDIPSCPNVDTFNYETMKNSLLERLDSFASAPFTIQRISELLTTPTKQYNRVDKFMRAIEKNIWVVSTREPGQREQGPVQDASGNLVNGVAPRVKVSVKHPKRGKSIEERIKSGHSQLIDDDEEEEEEEKDDAMEGKSQPELLANNDSEDPPLDAPLQCTSVKDLLEKYENGTIFCGTDEKTVQLEEPAMVGETNSSGGNIEERGGESNKNPIKQENDEEVNMDKLVTSQDCPTPELGEGSEDEKMKVTENKEKSDDDVSMPLVGAVESKEDGDGNDVGDVSDVNDMEDVNDTDMVAVNEVTDMVAVNDVTDMGAVNDVTDMEAVNDVTDMGDVTNVNDVADVPDVNSVNDVNDVNDVAMPLAEDIKEDPALSLSENCPTEPTNFCSEPTKPEVTEPVDESPAISGDSESVSVMKAIGLENEIETNETPQEENM